MALVLADRVRETTTTAGTGTITLLGAVPSCQSFAVVGDGNTTYYTIVAYSGTEWEVGIGTYTAAGTTLSRDTVLSSSNSGSLVNFSAGTKDVFVDYPAGKAVTTDTLAYPPPIGGTTPAAGTFTTLTATGQTSLGGVAGAEGLRVGTTASSVNFWYAIGSTTNAGVQFRPSGADASIAALFSSKGTNQVSFYTNTFGSEQARIAHTASAVNYVQVTGAATTAPPTISAQGSDAAVDLTVTSKTTGVIRLQTGGINVLRLRPATSGVNYFDVYQSATNKTPYIQSVGSDTNVPFTILTQGTGAIDLAAGSSGVNISNGGTVTAVTRTAGGSAYTTFPSVAISAPTTAGGVQATASVTRMFNSAATIAGGGTGYTVGDTLTVVGGTPISTAATYTVATVSAGVITSVTVPTSQAYTALPSNPVSVTGGTGSGATLNLTWAVDPGGLSITNAGSGYVEQPTVSFSGGGGSGAAAYATVGSATIIKSIGVTGGTTSLDFQTPASATNTVPVLRLRDVSVGTSNTGFVQIQNNNGYSSIIAQGPANAGINFASNGTGSISLNTNSTNETTQLRVAHTASAVNYVQVTGNITSNSPQISFTGSDAGVGGALITKGNGAISFFNNGTTTSRQFRIGAGVVTTAVNYINADGSATGNATQFQTYGTDTNIAMALRTSGTGAIDLAAGSSGVNISNGGSVTAITRTVQGSLYTSVPSLAISAPTTAGGVQATATANLGVLAATIVSGGTGYTAGDTLTVVGGTGTSAQLTVSTVSSGVITAVTVAAQNGVYSVFPTSPVSVTGGTGSSATFNISGGILSTFTITNAGTGYVEQPTVSFSGGGGSGAAAYATVGSVTTIKSIGASTTGTTLASIQFVTPNTANPNYPPLTIRDIANSDTGLIVSPNTGYAQLFAGNASNSILMLGSAGTSSIYFNTQGSSQTNQMRVAHTASAVNYVQVTGSITNQGASALPSISVQGSDATTYMGIGVKGTTGYIAFYGANATNAQVFRIKTTNASSTANFLEVTAGASGSAPVLGVSGTDTNIDLALTPKGTGVVQFGTYTATVTAVAGYILIKDSGGTTRKLAVLT